jgi:NitT/TauT family transport system permease protein
MSKVGWIRLAVIVLAIGLLEVCCRTKLINPKVVIPPSEMADALVQMLISGQVNGQIARTFGIVLLAAAISIVAGFAIGVVIHAIPRVRQALDPFFAT